MRQRHQVIDEQFNKKQMEFKNGRLHQLISDQPQNHNRVYANRYNGLIGCWYILVDTFAHIENLVAVAMIIVFLVMQPYYPSHKENLPFVSIVVLVINVVLATISNVYVEIGQRRVNEKINNRTVDYLMITRKVKRFLPIMWGEVKPGFIIRIKQG